MIEITEDEKTIGEQYTLKKYKCGYCGYEFKQFVRLLMSTKPYPYTQEGKCSTQVKCKHCGAFLKTWDEGEVIDVYKGKPFKRHYEIDEKIIRR